MCCLLLKKGDMTVIRNFENAIVLKVKIVKKPKVKVASCNWVFRQCFRFNDLKETSSKIQGASYNQESMACSRTSKSNNIPYLKFFVLLITFLRKIHWWTSEGGQLFYLWTPSPLLFFLLQAFSLLTNQSGGCFTWPELAALCYQKICLLHMGHKRPIDIHLIHRQDFCTTSHYIMHTVHW